VNFNETENQFAVLAEFLPQLVWSVRPEGYHDYFNRRWHEFTGLTPEQSVGAGWHQAVHPDDLPGVQARWEQSLEAGLPYECEYRIRNAAGGYEWVLSRAAPFRDASGEVTRWFGTSTNIDAQRKAEEALRLLEKQYRLALEATGLGTWTIDLTKDRISWDEGTCALYDIPHNGLYSLSLDEASEMIHPDDRESVKHSIAAASDPRSNGRYESQYRATLPDGKLRWFRSHGQALFVQEGSASRAVSISGVISDVTEGRASEEAQQLLTRELNHRVKNLFAIANGMVSMTARTARDPKEMATALRGRLSALSRAHELVQPVTGSSQIAGQEVGLAQLIEAVLEPYKQNGHSRILVEGPSVSVGSNTTTSLALVLHELATNAAKYGCLSKPGGQLIIRWELQNDSADLLWVESGGPAIGDPPSFEGFGTQLSQRSITGQLGGVLEREWRSEGLQVHMTLPLDRLAG
jgi:PAS domain S-box-containing protein